MDPILWFLKSRRETPQWSVPGCLPWATSESTPQGTEMLLNYLACEINREFLAVRSTWPFYQDATARLIKCPLSGRALPVLFSGLQRVWKGSLALGGLIKKSTSCYPKTNCSSVEQALPSGPFIPCFSLSPLHWEMWICHSWKEKRPWCSKENMMSCWRKRGRGRAHACGFSTP